MKDALILLLGLTIGLPLGFHALMWLDALGTQPPARIIVIDGDTVEHDGTRHRLLGFDTPEMRGKCGEEITLARRATTRLGALIASAKDVKLTPIGIKDRYGRQLSHLVINGRDVGETLIAERLARTYHGGRRQSWCGI